jgi:hypothetical protein
MFGLGKRTRAIADYDFNVGDGWHGVDFDPEETPRWAEDLAQEVESTRAEPSNDRERAGFLADLKAMRTRLIAARIEQPGMLAAIQVPVDVPLHIKCALVWRITNLEAGQTPQSYQAALDADEGSRTPGERYDIVTTWMIAVEVGVAVGAYNVITYTDPGEAIGRTEARTVITVFVDKSSQVLEFVFTTQDLATYDDMVELSKASIASLTVQLEK